MRQLFLATLFVCFIFFTEPRAQTVNSANLLKELLNLPAPPPDELLSDDVKSPVVVRDPEFYDVNRVPPDDAPIEDLLAYWGRQNQNPANTLSRYNLKPSEKTVERILEFCEDNPGLLYSFLNIFPGNPKTAESIKRSYEQSLQDEELTYISQQLRQWLTYNSNFYVDELLKKAERVRDNENYIVNQRELLALARVDWEKAAPILERLVNDSSQPVSATLARWAFYAHAIETDNDADINKYRRQLQDTVENRNLLPGNRDLAMDALVTQPNWEGRDDWYISLFSDETLYKLDRFTGLATILRFTPPEKMVPAMVKLVESKNPAVRKAAIKNLTNYLYEANIDAVRALLPWLTNPNWAGDVEGRSSLIAALARVDLPESVPGLITILTNEPENRMAAAQSLTRYKDARAVPALKLALANETSIYSRNVFINAISECGGYSDDEKLFALETYATAISTPEGLEKLNKDLGYYEQDSEPKRNVPLTVSIGKFVAEQNEPSDGLAMRAIERLKFLRKSKPAVANALAEIMRSWKGRIIYLERLRQIRDGEADLETILTALARRKEIRELNPNDVFALRNASGIGRGIGVCLAEESAEFLNILGQKDALALTAMLGCARLLRVKLPVTEIGTFLKNANKTLAIAAERYLETEDSVEARSLVLAEHQGEAVILGARQAFIPDVKNVYYSESLRELFESVVGRGFFPGKYSNLDKIEETLRNEMKANADLLVVYALLPNKPTEQQVVRVFKDKITFTNYEDTARYREKTLSAKEYEDFYRLLIDEKVDSTMPLGGACYDCVANEFVMFGRGGGRRVFFVEGSFERSPIIKIIEQFETFNQGNLKLHYLLADKIKGLEVLLADDKFEARSVWKNGNDLRVLVEDTEKKEELENELLEQFKIENSVEIDPDITAAYYAELQKRRESQEKRREEIKYAHFFWRGVDSGKLGEILPQPLEMPFLYDENQVPEAVRINPNPRAWQVRAGNYEIRTVYSEESGLYKISRLQEPVKLKDGNYDSPIVTADGNWVIASKRGEEWQDPKSLVRINIQTGKEFPVNLPPADIFAPIAFIASQNKVLIYRARGKKFYYEGRYERESQADDDEEETKPIQPDKNDKNPSPLTPEYYLLDAATGTTQAVKGEFRPLEQQTYRPLQMTTAPNEYWAAIYDKKLKETSIGRYNTKTFTFVSVTKLPDIKLDSMDIWVDEKEAKVYFVYETHLLAVPLQNPQK